MGYELGRTSQIVSEDWRLKKVAIALRQEATPAEEAVWAQLRGKRLQGLKFRRQHVLHGYIVDFYCHEKRLCIELDGAPHLEPEQMTKDAARDSRLEFKGYTVLRIMNELVLKDIARFRETILEAATKPHRVPPL